MRQQGKCSHWWESCAEHGWVIATRGQNHMQGKRIRMGQKSEKELWWDAKTSLSLMEESEGLANSSRDFSWAFHWLLNGHYIHTSHIFTLSWSHTHSHFFSIIRKKPRRDSGEEHVATSKGSSLLSSELEELSGIYYRPRTRETRSAYEILLSFIQQAIGDQVGGLQCIGLIPPVLVPYHLQWNGNGTLHPV